VDVNLITFLAGTNQSFVNKVDNLVRHWRIGTKGTCKLEADLQVTMMYLYMLPRLSGTYALTPEQITNVINSLVTILNVTNVNITNTTVINNIVTNIVNNTYININNITNINNEVPPYITTYAGVDDFTVTVIHTKNKLEVDVEVYENDITGLQLVYPDVTVIDENTVEVHFTSTSDGKIYIY